MTTDTSVLFQAFEQRLAAFAAEAETITTLGACWRLQRLADEAWSELHQGFSASEWERADTEPLRVRLNALKETARVRFIAYRQAHPETQAAQDERIVLEAQPPTLENFFYARHYSHKQQPVASAEELAAAVARTEKRLDIRLPEPLRQLYLRQDGGHTDFKYFPTTPDAAYALPDHEALFAQWDHPFPGQAVNPLDRLCTIGELSDGISFGADNENPWRENVPEVDRLIAINGHGSDIFLCLDYRGGAIEPRIVRLDDTKWDDTLKCVFECSDFATLFAGLRREAVKTLDGVLRQRGERILELLVDGQWRATRSS
ncbi:SMI1/KNR4 family protein [Variovorax sp. ZS18.2.2]|uniref:SMI1/KNR4 family protein n=1 Tax=Variovorax sp. ZS18.2.2 TaxID=2971255 RepID=UPI002151D454|nr:SMI1/KNR4 family protein [Variovorax sp. ZS18.2.2]MCR6477445.1 SMI1/KNR4 family protein [Variovorax sp. ZS18.2.2]